tara:strand:- start:1069 stop:2019 length:951 start_codon:yes stop_codon:yes gene_type:complete
MSRARDLADGKFSTDVEIENSSGATFKLTSTDTTGADTELLGQIDFVSSDSSTGSAGTQARIKGVYEDNGDSSGIAFLTGASTGSGTPTISEVMRIRHEGKVGISNASPSQLLSVGGDSSGTKVIQVTNSTAGTAFNDGMQMFINDDSGGLNMRENYPLRFFVNGSERLRILSGGGLTFNGDTAAANALDDYEEGTWTPTVTPSGGGSISITGTSAKYTKIGNQVTVWLKFQVSSVSSASGRIGVSGVPFSASGQPYAAVAHVNGFNTFAGKAGALVEASGTFNIDRYVNGGISADLATFAAASDFVFMTATYPVS